MLETIFQSSPIAIGILSPDRNWVKINPAVCSLLDAPLDYLGDRPLLSWVHFADKEMFQSAFQRVERGELGASSGEVRLINSRREIVWAHYDLFPTPFGRTPLMTIHLRSIEGFKKAQCESEISRRQMINRVAELEDEVARLQRIDSLTGAYNRRHFCQMLEGEVLRASHHAHRFSLVLLEFEPLVAPRALPSFSEQFQRDGALRQSVELMKSRLRRTDLLARVGELRFGVLAVNTSEDGAQLLARSMIRALHSKRSQGCEEVSSLAVAESALSEYQDGDTCEKLWQRVEGRLTASNEMTRQAA